MTAQSLARRAWFWLLVIVLVAAFFRLYRLHVVPPGFQFDEAYNAADALRVLGGERPLFLDANGGREVIYTYLQALLMSLIGEHVLALRLTSALLGLLTVALNFCMVRTMLDDPDHGERPRAEAQLVALASSAFMAITYWHVHFSRYGIRGVLLPLLEVCLVCAFWRGVQSPSLVWWVVAGILLGLGPYAHPAGRLLPFVITAFVLYRVVANRSALAAIAQWLVMGVVALVVFLPLGGYFLEHPDAFAGHAELVSVFTAQTPAGPTQALLDNAVAVLGMFAFHGDGAWNHNLSGRPVFGIMAAICMGVGVLAALGRLRSRRPLNNGREPYVFLFIWLAVMLSPSLLSIGAPDFSRTIGAIPGVMVFPALGLVLIAGWLGSRRRILGALAVTAVVATSGYATFVDYFERFPTASELYHIYDVDKIEVAQQLRQWSSEAHVYLAPMWAEHATIAFLVRGLGVKSFDTGETIVLPSRAAGKDAIYVFSWEQAGYVESFAERMGAMAERIDVPNSEGGELMVAFRVRADRLPDPERPIESLANSGFGLLPERSLRADFVGGVSLLGASLPEAVPAGESRPLALFWQARERPQGDYTVFVHAIDARGRRWGQDDRRPNHGGYPTTAWSPGDLVIDQYWPVLDPCAPEGQLQVVAGLYDVVTQARQKLAGGTETVPLGRVFVTPAEKLTLRDRKPQSDLVRDVGPLRLLGYDIPTSPVASGDVAPLNLFWQAPADVEDDLTWQITLAETGEMLWSGRPSVPTYQWQADDALCAHVDVTVPRTTTSGIYTLSLALAEAPTATVPIAPLHVEHQPRSFEAPNPDFESVAQLGDTVRFLGYDLGRRRTSPGETLPVTLYWQAAGPIGGDYTVFVHLLDGDELVHGQIDTQPVGGARPTSGWIPGEVVSDTIELPVPPEVKRGRYSLEIGMYQSATGERLPAFDDRGGALPGDRVLLDTPVDVVS